MLKGKKFDAFTLLKPIKSMFESLELMFESLELVS